MDMPQNAFTVDVEDYYHVSAFERHIPREHWHAQPTRVERSTGTLLELLAEHGVKATFFTLGLVAQRHPSLIRRIVDEGHELASHGWDHTRVTTMSPTQFRDDVDRTRKVLEDLGGSAVIGYRAPTFSFTRTNTWVYPILAETGHRYSSSVAPVRHDLYGIPDAPRGAWRDPSGITEIPISTVRVGGHNLPCGGGGFFRLYPYSVSRWCLRRVNGRDAMPGIFYMHPWELDPAQPRPMGIGMKTRFRHYLNLHRLPARLEALLRDFKWRRMDEVFAV